MPARISDLHAKFLTFARGMPAIAISWEQIERDVAQLQTELSGRNPDNPSPYMGDVPMPVYRLASSVFVQRLLVQHSANGADLTVEMIANVHPLGHPELVIRSYLIVTRTPAPLTLDLDAHGDVYWQTQGMADVEITPSWGSDADAILATTPIPAPQRQNYLDEVERQVIWLTKASFVRLVADALPRYELAEMVPWLRLQPPLRVDFSPPHLVITSSRATMDIGGCTPATLPIEPDPAFPYGRPIPAPQFRARGVDMAVYAPRTRLVDFVAKDVEPAVLTRDSGGGFIKWEIAGAFGLKRLVVEIATGQGAIGVLSLAARVDYVGVARAWIDGPSGLRLSLASGSVIGDGELAADITAELRNAYLELNLRVKKADIDPKFDLSLPILWPLTIVVNRILDVVAKRQVKKFEGKVTHLGRWDMLVVPLRILESLKPTEKLRPYAEGLEDVAAYVAVTRQAEGKEPPRKKPPKPPRRKPPKAASNPRRGRK